MVNRINGTAADDLLVGQPGKDIIRGNKGSDTLQAATALDDPATVGKDVLRGGKGADLIDVTGLGGDQKAYGNAGRDFILFGHGADFVNGGGGGDGLQWTSGLGQRSVDLGVDTVFGGGGTDYLSVDFSLLSDVTSVSVVAGTGPQRAIQANGATIIEASGIENMELEVRQGADLVQYDGLDGIDQLQAGLGAHNADLASGDDLFALSLDAQVDTLDGGDGEDFLILEHRSFENANRIGITGDSDGLREVKINGNLVATIDSFERVSLNVFDGTNLSAFTGSTGDDTLSAGTGRHRAALNSGDDSFELTLDSVRDVIKMGAGEDTVIVNFGEIDTDMVINLNNGTFKTEGKTLAKFNGGEIFVVNGSGTSSDAINGTAGNDTLSGGSGADTLRGNAGDDVLVVSTTGGFQSEVFGGAGTDILDVFDGMGLDAGLSMDMRGTSGSSVSVKVDGVQTVTGTDVEQVFITGSAGDDTLLGLAGDDSLEGGAGNDTINGRAGDDLITTGGGNDTVKGGSGADTFIFDEGSQGAGNVLIVRDFRAADSLALVDAFYDGDTFVEGETPQFSSGAGLTTATGTGSQFIYDTDTGRLFLDLDGAGGDDADLLARLRAGGNAANLDADQIDII